MTSLPAFLICTLLLFIAADLRSEILRKDGAYHVFPGDDIQQALDAAGADREWKVVKVHAGEYRPSSRRQALIWFNRTHDGVTLEAVGEVTLTAANPELSNPQTKSHPAIVNHVVYFGDGVSTNTILRGVRITGANGFVTRAATFRMEPDRKLPKGLFFYADGGGIKIFGRSYPTLLDVHVVGNYASPCAGGVSIQHDGERNREHEAVFINCIFEGNRAQVTGAAVDLLPGSNARFVNCLFIGNVANTGPDYVSAEQGREPFTNSAALTVFHESRAVVENCTFTDNRNGVDDMSDRSVYSNTIFWQNRREGGLEGGQRYELDVQNRATITNCFFGGEVLDPHGQISATSNTKDAPPPEFDRSFAPQARAYERLGYRPVAKPATN